MKNLLRSKSGMQIEKDVDLQPYNTLQIPVKAKYFVKIENESDILELMENDLRKSEKHCILSGGANILFTHDFDGIVVKIELQGKELIKSEDNSVLVEAMAGENRSDFVERTCENNGYGVENLIDIPGNVGTAPVSNIGAYGTEVSSVVFEIEGIDLVTGTKKIFKNSECEFGYRTSIFKYKLKGKFLVTKVRFLLSVVDENYTPNIGYADVQKFISEKGINPRTPKEVAEIIREIRANKLPDWHKIGTAGSFFSNPIITLNQRAELEKSFPDLSHHECIDFGEKKMKLSAGQLIDCCGLKGWRIPNGTVGTYSKHALILVNEGGDADDVLEAMHYIQESVKDKFGVQLEPEVVLI